MERRVARGGAQAMRAEAMNRIPAARKRGHRELWIVGLLVLPLVVAGFVLAGMGVLVDPPPVSVPAATPASPAATPAPRATPAPAADRITLEPVLPFVIVA
ncbi:MAG: hypothetical protein AVDCRST_MAG87-586 [uncultured Thermomicrobiales bacterium]|uniref:Uncharacterized protein n=1 Tax=uncultured Thermomicrobiales bacterium TaxID=1645740 RepID=A0A6J4UDA0_9BACT|nr:MAG: hypothetical protein AVDCRST_MAG87-586 [uncultured Thermomicrobiales bacterium]